MNKGGYNFAKLKGKRSADSLIAYREKDYTSKFKKKCVGKDCYNKLNCNNGHWRRYLYSGNYCGSCITLCSYMAWARGKLKKGNTDHWVFKELLKRWGITAEDVKKSLDDIENFYNVFNVKQ